MPDEKTSALDFTPEERAAADESFVDPDQWEGNFGDPDAPEAEEADDA